MAALFNVRHENEFFEFSKWTKKLEKCISLMHSIYDYQNQLLIVI